MNKRSLNKLANDRWEYVEAIIRNEHKNDEDTDHYVNMIEFHYKSALVLGFKLGVQWKEAQGK